MMWTYESELVHHGVKGMKWGVRRYQNPDGSWKSAGNNRRTDTGVKPGAKARPSGGSGGGSKKKDISGNPKVKKAVNTKDVLDDLSAKAEKSAQKARQKASKKFYSDDASDQRHAEEREEAFGRLKELNNFYKSKDYSRKQKIAMVDKRYSEVTNRMKEIDKKILENEINFYNKHGIKTNKYGSIIWDSASTKNMKKIDANAWKERESMNRSLNNEWDRLEKQKYNLQDLQTALKDPKNQKIFR